MENLEQIKAQLAALREEQNNNIAARNRISRRRKAMEPEVKALDKELNKLSLSVAMGDDAEAMFYMKYEQRMDCIALLNLCDRADKGLEPLLNNKSRSNEILQLQKKVKLAQDQKIYSNMLEK